jgi:hypothetical protein
MESTSPRLSQLCPTRHDSLLEQLRDGAFCLPRSRARSTADPIPGKYCHSRSAPAKRSVLMSTSKKLLPIALALAFTSRLPKPPQRHRRPRLWQVRRKRCHPGAVGWGYRLWLWSRLGGPDPAWSGAGVVIGSIIATRPIGRARLLLRRLCPQRPVLLSLATRRSALDLCPELPLVRVETGLTRPMAARDGSAPT